ncbi:hypothetical protein FOA52_008044 [Chlamydomonas sp. UWO 241]|nr:hypothetical protein FOA52_008044 [Chlamydomonas sp. UWO 241]
MARPLAGFSHSARSVRVAVLEWDRLSNTDNANKASSIGDLEILSLSSVASGTEQAADPQSVSAPTSPEPVPSGPSSLESEFALRKVTRSREQASYQLAAIAASSGVTALAIMATYFRFQWHMEEVGVEATLPLAEVFATLSLVAGGAFGMEMWARWAHQALWHDYEPGWALHKSHHEPRTGPFEANDIFAIINGVPAMALCAFGFLTPGIVGGMCFGSGLGISLFGIAYMFIHDGLVHRRFPVGPLAQLPSMKKIAVAHQLHHSGKYGGAPWGMFLGPQELENIPGAKEELERLAEALDWSKR